MLCLCLITAYDSSEKMHIISRYVDISSSSPLFIKFHSISNVHHRTVNDTNSIYFGVYNINTFHYKKSNSIEYNFHALMDFHQ